MADKTEYALHHGLKAIVCIGETLEQRESGELWNVLDSQLKVRGSEEAAVKMYAPMCAECQHGCSAASRKATVCIRCLS